MTEKNLSSINCLNKKEIANCKNGCNQIAMVNANNLNLNTAKQVD
ncbi:MAG: hypothetical protein NTW17_03190 [Candidatus Pacearchaeota archaeon]|nr:hypothetical protein [Candidatus Pacearchaeota archaeon]